MANIIRDVDHIEITKLISEIDRDKVCLPDFQREFVWTPEQMAKLVESVIRQYPIGTLMFLKANMNQTFGKRSFRETNEEFFTPDYYVIDGQQRLNTFYRLFRPPDRFEPFEPIEHKGKNYKIFFKITTNIDNIARLNPDIDKPSFIIAKRTETDDKADYERQGKEKLIPIEFILNDKYVDEWIKCAVDRLKEKERYRENIFKIKKIIEEYKCVIEKAENKLNSQDHYNIFQLLNKEGTDLTIFDLLVAKLNQIDVNLRILWKDSKTEYPNFNSYDLDPVYILKTVSLIKGTKNKDKGEIDKNPTCTKKDLMNLYKVYHNKKDGSREFKEDWKDACKYLNKAFDEMKYKYGVYNKKYIPYSPMIVTLAAIWWWFDKYKGYEQIYKPRMQEKIDNWYWGSIFNREYDSRTDNKISDHYIALRKWIGPKALHKIPDKINFKKIKEKIPDMIDEIDSSADARYKAIICLPLINNAKDIYSNEFLHTSKLHDHHIFPRKFLKEKGIEDGEKINNIVNRMLITDATNLNIQGKSPYDYLEKVDPNNILEKHFLPKTIVTENLDYDEFCEERKEKICEFIIEELLEKG